VSATSVPERRQENGQAPLEQAPVDVQKTFSGVDLLKEGQSVPNTTFLDQDGRKRDLQSFTGRRWS
jgi:hypothetical protein